MTNEERIEKIEFLKQYGINAEEYKVLIGKDYEELETKINYLLSNNIPLQKDGKLNPMFWMNYTRIEKIFGITREDLFNLYGNKAKSK